MEMPFGGSVRQYLRRFAVILAGFIPKKIWLRFGMTKSVRLRLFPGDIHSKSDLSAFWNEKIGLFTPFSE